MSGKMAGGHFSNKLAARRTWPPSNYRGRSRQKPRFLPAAEPNVRKMAGGHFSNKLGQRQLDLVRNEIPPLHGSGGERTGLPGTPDFDIVADLHVVQLERFQMLTRPVAPLGELRGGDVDSRHTERALARRDGVNEPADQADALWPYFDLLRLYHALRGHRALHVDRHVQPER